jgi:hypothetical protein
MARMHGYWILTWDRFGAGDGFHIIGARLYQERDDNGFARNWFEYRNAREKDPDAEIIARHNLVGNTFRIIHNPDVGE